MKFFTAHTRLDREPVLLAEGFRWGAFLFGPFWLFRHRAYIPAALDAAILISIPVLAGGAWQVVLLLTAAILLGLNGNDLRRWSLARRGFLLSDVVAARDAEAALATFLARRPEQASRVR
ncbi:MAG: DUF2628 domain-containing protein [Rhodospirillales bacterium]|nr:DUF2628 domain-containing protein [Rhodospirillales bacterium]